MTPFLLGQDTLLPNQKQLSQVKKLRKEVARISRAISLYAGLVRDFRKNRQNDRFIERIEKLSGLLGNYLSRPENLERNQAACLLENLVICYEWNVELETIEPMTEKKEIKNLKLNAASELQVNFQLSRLHPDGKLLSLRPLRVVFAYRTDQPGMPYLNWLQKRRLPMPYSGKEVTV